LPALPSSSPAYEIATSLAANGNLKLEISYCILNSAVFFTFSTFLSIPSPGSQSFITSLMACRCGGASPADLTDANTISVFQQGVASYNASNGTNLQFVSVESATKQVVSGYNFKGIVNVTNNGTPEKYDITVWQKAGGQSIEVTNFTKV
jgi:hypothetical protein